MLVCGIETHVCIMQTAFDLVGGRLGRLCAVDAVGTRHDIDHETALRRMESAGVVLTTTEAAMFEWCRDAGTAEFKKISALAKETGADDSAARRPAATDLLGPGPSDVDPRVLAALAKPTVGHLDPYYLRSWTSCSRCSARCFAPRIA